MQLPERRLPKLRQKVETSVQQQKEIHWIKRDDEGLGSESNRREALKHAREQLATRNQGELSEPKRLPGICKPPKGFEIAFDTIRFGDDSMHPKKAGEKHSNCACTSPTKCAAA